MLTALFVLVVIVVVQEWRADRLKKQVKSLRESRDLHARALRYSRENASRGAYVVGIDATRALVWVAYDHLAGELYAPQALQKILVGQWERVPSLSDAGCDCYGYHAPAPRPGAEQQ